MDLRLTGKRALVTGGSKGIGRAIAKSLLAEGARVVIAARDRTALDITVTELGASGGEIYGIVADTRREASVRDLVAGTSAKLGGLDIVVNAAAQPGSPPRVPGAEGVDDDAAKEEFDTKVLGYLRVARAAAPHLVANGWGRIINISGLAARRTGSIVGSIRNVAVSALTKNLADEFGPQGINVTVVHPGATRTERTAGIVDAEASATGLTPDQAEKKLFGGSLIGRIVEADEVAAVVTFLASPLSAAINGDAIAAGGGQPGPIVY